MSNVISLVDKFRERSKRQAMTVDVIRLAIDLYAREELGIDEDVPYFKLPVDDQDALKYLKDAFRSRIAAELIVGGKASERPVATALLAEFSL